MGLTLIAILTAALLLPGLIAARAFYFAAQTKEVEVPVPPLTASDGIALVGFFSVVVHLVYIASLTTIAKLPPLISAPVANPYLLFTADPSLAPLDAAYALFAGLTLLSILAAVVGFITGRIAMLRKESGLFYGPLADVIRSSAGDDAFITAYVVTKIAHQDRLVGYQGTVASLFRDGDRYPSKVILRDVVPFYLYLGEDAPKRIETDQFIDWLALSSTDWHNIAFKVFRLVDDDPSASVADAAAVPPMSS